MTAIDLPAQACHLHLAGGRIQRPGDPASPVYRGALDSSAGAIALDLLADPGGLYDPRSLIDVGHMSMFGYGQMASANHEDPEIERLEGWPSEIVVEVDDQKVELLPLPPREAEAYRVPVLTGIAKTSIGDWSVIYVDREIHLSIGSGSFLRT